MEGAAWATFMFFMRFVSSLFVVLHFKANPRIVRECPQTQKKVVSEISGLSAVMPARQVISANSFYSIMSHFSCETS
jgi:hypothetical protein